MSELELPLLNPSAAEVYSRLQAVRDSGLAPDALSMSPETWVRLQADSAFAIAVGPQDLRFDHVPVKLYEGALGVGITYTRARR